MWISPDPARQFASPYSYGPNPINSVDLDGKETLQLGVSGNAGALAGGSTGGGFALGFSRSHGFQFGFYGDLSWGAILGFGASATVNVGVSNFDDIRSLGGKSVTYGASGGELLVAGADMTWPMKIGADGHSYTDFSPDGGRTIRSPLMTLHLGVGAGSPLEFHMTPTITGVKVLAGDNGPINSCPDAPGF
jgi:hypothetical protein